MNPSTTPTTDLSAELSFELHTAARLLRKRFERGAAVHGATRSRWQMLWTIARREGLKQAELADIMDVAPISVARQLDNLEREGLVERRRDPRDRRCFRLYLTDAAQPVLDLLRPIALETRRAAFEGLSATEIKQLHKLLIHVRQNLNTEELAST